MSRNFIELPDLPGAQAPRRICGQMTQDIVQIADARWLLGIESIEANAKRRASESSQMLSLVSLPPGLSNSFRPCLHVTVHGAYAHGPGDGWTSLAFLIAIPGSQTNSLPWAMAWQQIATGVACFRATPPALLDQIRNYVYQTLHHGRMVHKSAEVLRIHFSLFSLSQTFASV